MEKKEKDSKRFISPAGAGLAVIMFFLPWVKACGGNLSGADIARINNEFWLILISAIAIVGAFFYFDNQNKLSKLKPIVVVGALLSLGIILFKFAKVKSEGMIEIQYGVVLTVIGFVVSLFGITSLEDHESETEKSISLTSKEVMPPDSWKCDCGYLNYPSATICQGCLKVRNSSESQNLTEKQQVIEIFNAGTCP